jgi:hypothetical protein
MSSDMAELRSAGVYAISYVNDQALLAPETLKVANAG